MHRARAILQAAFYDYPVDDLYSLIFGEEEDIGTEFIKGMGLAVSVRDEDTNMASCELDVSRLGLINGDIFGNCFDKAGEFAHDVFETGGSLKIQQEHLLKWRGITRLIGEELLTTAYIAKYNIRTVLCWQDVREVDCPWLDGILKDGVCDIHSHLNANYDAYLINWIGLMNQIVGKAYFFDKLEHPKDNPVVLRDYHFADLYSWCILAAKIRCCLYEYFVKGGKSVAWFMEQMEAFSELRHLTYYNGLVEDVENSLIEQREKSKWIYQRDDILDYAIDMNMTPVLLDSPYAVLSGERKIMYSFLMAYYHGHFRHSKIIQLAYLYERIKTEFRKELVQTNRKTGLVNFKLYNSSKDSFSKQEKGLKDVMRAYGVQTSLYKPNCFLEGRFCVRDAEDFMKLQYDKGILSKKTLNQYNGRVKYVIHLTRKNTLNTNRLEIGRRNAWKDEINAFLFMHDRSKSFTGIDFAGSELYTRPETAAGTIKYARAHGINQITYHVGEDYYDLLDGLRAIDECIRFCEMDEHCRLGHAMAMGVNAKNFYRQNDLEIVLPRQYYLDNLVWMIKKSREEELHLDVELERWALAEAERVYGEIGYVGHFNMDQYYVCMLMRGDDNFDRPGDGPEQRLLWAYLNNNRIIENGNIPITMKVRKDYIKQVVRIQKAVCRMVADKGICVESNLTSNVLISNVRRYDAHPIVSFRKIGGRTQRELKVTLGTDDKGVFATSLYNEYALLVTSMMKKKRKQGYDAWYDQHVADFIKHLAENSMNYRFQEWQ